MKDSDWQLLTVLYEKKSMTKAAESLYMTQPAFTKRIRAIEEEWGVNLVRRSSQGVTFTEDGLYLVSRSRIMIDFLNEIREHFNEERSVKTLLRLGVPNSFARLHMPQLLKNYIEKINHIQFRIVLQSSDMLIQQLTNHSIDAAIICGDYPYLRSNAALFKENLYMITPKGIRMEQVEHMTVIESYFNPLVKLTIDQWWMNQFGEIPVETHKVPNADIAIEMVGSGLGVTFVFGLDWKFNEETVQRIPVYDHNGDLIGRNVWLMYDDPCCQNTHLCEFIDFVKKFYGAVD